MLTKTQLRNLVKKDDLDKVTRAKYEYIAVKKLMDTLDKLGDADIILSKVPKNKLQKYLKDDHVETLLRTSTSLMRKLDFNKVRSIDDETLFIYMDDETHHIQSVPPSERDIQRAKILYKNLYELEAFLDPDLLDRGAEIPGYEQPKQDPGGWHDTLEAQQRQDEEEKITAKIKEILASGIEDIDQIAEMVGCHPVLVFQVIYYTQKRENNQAKKEEPNHPSHSVTQF